MTEVGFQGKPGGKSGNWVPVQWHDLMQLQTAEISLNPTWNHALSTSPTDGTLTLSGVWEAAVDLGGAESQEGPVASTWG